MVKFVYARVVSHGNGQKVVTIPKDAEIEIGEYVRLEKVE